MNPIITVDSEGYTIDGMRYPRMTHVMKVIPKPYLKTWAERIGEDEAARIRYTTADTGKLIHKAIELSNLGRNRELDALMDKEPWLLPYLWAWVEYRDKYIKKVIWVERTVWSRKWKVAGTLDNLVLYYGDEFTSILDLKSTKSLGDSMGVQLYGYREMVIEMVEAEGLPGWMVPQRTIIAHLPGPRETDAAEGREFSGVVKVKEYEHTRYREKFEDCIEQYYALMG